MTNACFQPVHRISIQTLLFLFLVSSCLSMIRADQSKTSTLDKNTIYRLDLFTETLKAHSKKDLKPGAVYFRFSPLSGHHVWSRFSEKRIFEFAMGPGSVQPAWRFDIREGREDQLRLLEKRSPELYKRLMVQGARPMIKLLDNGRWDLDLASNEDESSILKQVVVGNGTVVVESVSYTPVEQVGHIKTTPITRPIQFTVRGSNG